MRTRPRARTAVGLVTATALLALAACGGGDGGSDAAETSPSSSASPSEDASRGAGPDLAGIPDVVAEVNGEEVTKEEFVPVFESSFQQAAMQAQSGGEAPDEEALKKQAVDDLVDTELLAQEAESRGIEVSDDEIDAELASLAEQNGLGSAEELLAAVADRGVSEELARAQVETQVMVEQLVADEGGAVEPTEKELRALYEQAKRQAQQQAQSGQGAQGGPTIPPFAEVRDQIEQQAVAEEVGTVAQALVEELREDADITVRL